MFFGPSSFFSFWFSLYRFENERDVEPKRLILVFFFFCWCCSMYFFILCLAINSLCIVLCLWQVNVGILYFLIPHCWFAVNQTWSQPVIKGSPPTPRDSHTCTAIGDNLFVFGGTDGINPLKDLHILDTCQSSFSYLLYMPVSWTNLCTLFAFQQPKCIIFSWSWMIHVSSV